MHPFSAVRPLTMPLTPRAMNPDCDSRHGLAPRLRLEWVCRQHGRQRAPTRSSHQGIKSVIRLRRPPTSSLVLRVLQQHAGQARRRKRLAADIATHGGVLGLYG